MVLAYLNVIRGALKTVFLTETASSVLRMLNFPSKFYPFGVNIITT